MVAHETRVGVEIAGKLVSIAERARNLKGHGLDERWRSNSKNTRTYWDIGLYRASAATLRAAGIIGVGFRFGG
ncbi:CbbQ/NirQ/NorQ C-terminal domain-containing protein [Acidithiobacillus ferriphilus]|uniref:CbbQ/NirQ/NorQ domain-containing protein n=1 Tax=Acidithiobacillus ferriphilus TaxID=1689834 RepID=UPI00390C631E